MRSTLLLLIAACCLQAALCAITVNVETKRIELEENEKSVGARFSLSKSQTITLNCTVQSDGDALTNTSVVWRKAAAASNASLDERFHHEETLSSDKKSLHSLLTIKRAQKSDITKYICQHQQAKGEGAFTSLPLLSIKVQGMEKYDADVWGGEGVAIYCEVEGNPPGSVEWTKDNDPSYKQTQPNITLESVKYETDRGYLTCSSNNTYGSNYAKFYLRVKNPNAFVVPLIIIVVEVVVIAVIVVAYELYMKKKRQEAEAADKTE